MKSFSDILFHIDLIRRFQNRETVKIWADTKNKKNAIIMFQNHLNIPSDYRMSICDWFTKKTYQGSFRVFFW